MSEHNQQFLMCSFALSSVDSLKAAAPFLDFTVAAAFTTIFQREYPKTRSSK
jgi:hypothetical protein